MKYKFFWGGIYSNWYKSPFTVPNIFGEKLTFNCGEQYMMYVKAMLFRDVETARKILKESNPREQKKLGRQVKNFDSKIWDESKVSIMTEGLKQKFTQNKDLKAQLLKEDCDLFVEASPYDRIWGIGYSEADALNFTSDWGENLLGLIITRIRDEFCNI